MSASRSVRLAACAGRAWTGRSGMARLSFSVGTRFLWQQQVYIVREVLLDGKVRLENLSFGGWPVYDAQELVTAWAAGALIFEVRGRAARTLPDQPIATAYTLADFQALADTNDPAAQQRHAVAWYRYRLLLPLLQLPAHERTRRAIRDYLAQLPPDLTPAVAAATPQRSGRGRVPLQTALSYKSIERWLHALTEAGGDIRALVPTTAQQGGPAQLRLPGEVETLIQTVFSQLAAHPRQRTATDIYLAVVNAIAQENRQRPTAVRLALPGATTIYRRVVAAGSEQPGLRRRARSRVEAQAEASADPGPRTTRIWQRVEEDHTWLDLCVVDMADRLPIGRPTLTFVRDHYSGLVVGCYAGFEPPSYRTVAHALAHAILPKPDAQALYGTQHGWPPECYGLPELLAVDNGKDFAGHDLADACAQLGIIRELLPPQTPWWKGAIERQFRTTNSQLLHGLPGTTFSNLVQRGDYDPARDACISLDAFWRILHIYLLDYYAQNWHRGVGGVPAHRWAGSLQAGFLPVLPHSAEEVRILLYRSEERTVQRQGIAFENLFYNSPRLAAIRTTLPKGTPVRFKYNPADLQRIYVADPTNAGQWLAVPSTDPDYTTGLSLWKHRVIQDFVLRQKRSEVHIEDLAAARAHIQQIVEDEFRLTRRQRTRRTAARFLDLGVTEPARPAPTPPALPAVDFLAPPPALSIDDPATTATEAAPVPLAAAPATTRRRTRRATTPVPIVPALPDLDLDQAGWGSDYALPPPRREEGS